MAKENKKNIEEKKPTKEKNSLYRCLAYTLINGDAAKMEALIDHLGEEALFDFE